MKIPVLLALILAVPAFAETDTAMLEIELNRVDPIETGCRLTFTASNGLTDDVDQMVLETALFGREGGVLDLLLFDFREVPASSTRVRQFDIADHDCDEIGGFLVNGSQTCVIDGTAADACESTRATSRAEIEARR